MSFIWLLGWGWRARSTVGSFIAWWPSRSVNGQKSKLNTSDALRARTIVTQYVLTATHVAHQIRRSVGGLQLTSDVKQRPLRRVRRWRGRAESKLRPPFSEKAMELEGWRRVVEKRKEHTSAKVIARVSGCPRARSAHTYPSFSRSETGQKRETVTSSSEPTTASSSISRLFHGCSLSLTHPSGGASSVFALLSKS